MNLLAVTCPRCGADCHAENHTIRGGGTEALYVLACTGRCRRRWTIHAFLRSEGGVG